MANERTVLCGGADDTNLPNRGTPLRLRLWGRSANATLEINDIGKALAANVPAAFADLLDIATYVYCADQAITRGGDGVENVGADWRRRMHFRIPVRALDLWSDDRAHAMLATTLGFLSEDEYTFEFVQMQRAPSLGDYLFGCGNAEPGEIEEVILFSGGLDSLGGAVREAVVDKRRVALITHQPSKKLVRRYGKLKEQLTSRATHAPLFVPVTINKMKSLGREYTQRSRSFLYAALGATVAQMLGLSRVRFYENGVVSLNFPPAGQVVGARATRTTHPQVLEGFARIFSLVAGRRFEVENPFLWKTKAEVIQDIVSAGCKDMIRFSTSCTHTWEMTRLHPHCGSCSQCIDRRFAVLAAGAEEEDPEQGYKVRLLVGERDEDEPRTMLALYVETASQVARMSPVDFFSRFGEASRVVRHIGHSPDAAAAKVYELQRRHAQQVNAVVESAIRLHVKEIRERSLPESCLLRLVLDSARGSSAGAADAGGSTASEPGSSLATNVFRRQAQRAWQVRFGGGQGFVLLKSTGAAYLHILLSNQGTPISAAQLASTVSGQPQEYMLGDGDDASDEEALDAYRTRYEELAEEMQQARKDNDAAAKQRIEREMGELGSRIKRDRGLGGRPRKTTSPRERVRVRVANAITRAVKQIAQDDSALAAHLRPPTLKGGHNPCYAPSEHMDWDLT